MRLHASAIKVYSRRIFKETDGVRGVLSRRQFQSEVKLAINVESDGVGKRIRSELSISGCGIDVSSN